MEQHKGTGSTWRYKLTTGNHVLSPTFQVYKQNDSDDEWLAASPDGEIYEFPSKGLLEIKCPFYGEHTRMANPWARIPLHYVIQAQGLVEIFENDWMDFHVWTPRGSSLFRMKIGLHWSRCYQISGGNMPTLQRSGMITDPLLELKSFRPAPKHEKCDEILQRGTCIIAESRLLIYEIHGKLQNM